MIDVVDGPTRSRMMAGIRGRDTQPEMALRSGLHRLGLRFRLHARGLPGRPDMVLPRHRAVVFVHGCFWHRHKGCRLTTTPRTRAEFWAAKFDANMERDARNTRMLIAAGWRVAIVWECALRSSRREATVSVVADWIRSPHLGLLMEIGDQSSDGGVG